MARCSESDAPTALFFVMSPLRMQSDSVDGDGAVLDNSSSGFVTGVSAFFATMYFIQGVGDPTSGLIAQPVRSLLKSWGDSPATIAAFMGLLALPWTLKPLLGLLCDLVPLFGSRRRNYL